MEALARHLPEFAVAAALAWGAGLRVYATLFCVGLAGMLGWVDLPSQLHVLQSPLVLGASGFMTLVEFFADKIPYVDSLWDLIHTAIRPLGGALIAVGTLGEASAPVEGLIALIAAFAAVIIRTVRRWFSRRSNISRRLSAGDA